jgi:hypothetical protein
MIKKIQEEITNDPQNVGYAKAKDDTELASLLSNGYQKPHIVMDDFPSPLNRILVAMSDSPNIVDSADVASVKTTVIDTVIS